MKRISTAVSQVSLRRQKASASVSRILRVGVIAVCCLTIVGSIVEPVSACPLCLAPSQTWAEMIAEADVVLLAEVVSRDEGSAASHPFCLVRVVRVHKGGKLLPTTEVLRIEEYVFAEEGDLLLVKGSLQDVDASRVNETFAVDTTDREPASTIQKVSATEVLVDKPETTAARELVWESLEPCSLSGFEYVTKAPSPDEITTERLKYFLPFLENADPLVATDAWSEFANAEYQDIKSVSGLFSSDNLRKWIANPDAGSERVGLYGLMLGLCGTEADAAFLRQQISPSEAGEIRFGLEGLMGGLLLLAGEDGLEFLEASRLNNAGASTFDCFPVIQAVQFAWSYEPELFEKDRLRQALHPLLQREELREIVIRDLARWEDWNVVGELTAVYKSSQADDARTVKAIVGFLILCQQSGSKDDGNVIAATTLLDTIRTENARLVRLTERELGL